MSRRHPADVVSAYAIGGGIGLICLQLTWLVGNRIATALWDVPVGPTVGFVTALVVGGIASLVAGRKLARKVQARADAVSTPASH